MATFRFPVLGAVATSTALTLALSGCGEATDADGAGAAPAAEASDAPRAADLLAEAVAHPRRDAAERARDAWRHPEETLLFFEVEPDMTVVEVWPGGGWYTNVLAPYLKAGGGAYVAAGFDPDRSPRAAAAAARFAETFAAKPDVYGDIRITTFAPPAEDDAVRPIAPSGSADRVLTFRNVHNWIDGGFADEAFVAFYDALKPGGVLGVVEHRADALAGGDLPGGYVAEDMVKRLAEAAGFVFIAASEANANPADTKDHPFGVWTLPPVRRSALAPGAEDPDFDRAKYDAIGESDRMTLKFRKPADDA
ncbi:MAG: class I SAM-dependent methyltransferase [Parvularculaceae bacterium]